MNTTKAAIWATAGVLGAGVIGGITYAAVATPAGASQQLGAAADAALSDAQSATGQPGMMGQSGGMGPQGRMGRRALLQRIEHGELTLQARNGTRTVDLQRGVVTAVSPTSISVTSPDGFKGTYAVDSSTKVRTKDGLQTISVVHDNDTVFVVATAGKAIRIIDRAH
jgi:hypothetical protein